VTPEPEKSESMRTVAWTIDASGVRGAEGVAAANDGALGRDLPAFPSFAVETAWDAAAIEAIENELTHFIGPVAKVVVSRAMQDTTDLGSLCTAVARSITLDNDRRQFLIRVNNLGQSRPLSTANGGGNAATSSSARGYPDPSAADANLGEIEQALTHHIGPIAKVIVKRARAKGGTRDELCEHLAMHIEREDERRQFFASIAR
jgi:serine/threonine-protein kinase